MTTVNYDELEDAFYFASSASGLNDGAFISLETGRIYWISDAIDQEEDLPDDLETSDRYLPVPGKNDLDLGKRLALRFVEEKIPDALPEARQLFRHKGAYAKFKHMLESRRLLDEWHRFEAEATKVALVEWCKDNGIDVTGV